MKIILEAKDIPIGSSVKKEDKFSMTGVLINNIQVIADGETYENRAHPDCLFIMVPHNIGSLEAITPDTKLEWVIKTLKDVEKLDRFLAEEHKFIE